MKENVLGLIDKLFFPLALLFTAYMLYSNLFPQDIATYQSSFILGVALLSGLLAVEEVLKDPKLGNGFRYRFKLTCAVVISIVAVLSCLYLLINNDRLEKISPFLTDRDLIVGWFLILSIILLNWFHWGVVLTGIVLLAVAYFFWGHILPPPLGHAPMNAKFVMSYLGMNTTGGLFWMVPSAADEVYFLVLFSALLVASGMLPLVLELGKLVGNHVRGGAAFPALIGSGLTGTVMGYAVSNVMLTGQMTIPMMKQKGFSPKFAGAIEATASTNGQIMPPIMGLAAFIIAVFLNIPYITVALAAVLPAVLNIVGVTICVLLGARDAGHGFLNERVDRGILYNLFPTFLVSFTVVLVLLLMFISPGRAGIVGSLIVLVAMFIRSKKYWPKRREFIAGVKSGMKIVVTLSLILVVIGPIAQMATVTNLAGSLGLFIMDFLPESLLSLLVACMIASLILGMGLPTPVCYLMVALLLVPFMAELGFKGLPAHFFVMYFAVFSTLTPPVAVGALAASKLANASFAGTCLEAMKLVVPSYLVPFVYAYHPEIVAFPNVSWAMGYWSLFSVLLMSLCAVGFYGFLNRRLKAVERALFLVGTALGFVYLVNDTPTTAMVFYVFTALLVAWVFFGPNRLKKVSPA